MSLVGFLNARLDEDEQAARDAYYEGQRWISEEEDVNRWPDDEAVHTADRKCDAAHIARHDPARVLADVAAKRAVLDLLETAEQHAAEVRRTAADYVYVQRAEVPRDALLRAVQALALPYADHPDYCEHWRP